MLGWDFSVYPLRFMDGPGQPRKDATLATWETGLGGLDWVEELARRGRAVSLGGNGYPFRFVLTAAELRPILETGLPRPTGPAVVGDDYFKPADWLGRAKINLPALRQLDPSDLLVVEAWDQS